VTQPLPSAQVATIYTTTLHFLFCLRYAFGAAIVSGGSSTLNLLSALLLQLADAALRRIRVCRCATGCAPAAALRPPLRLFLLRLYPPLSLHRRFRHRLPRSMIFLSLTPRHLCYAARLRQHYTTRTDSALHHTGMRTLFAPRAACVVWFGREADGSGGGCHEQKTGVLSSACAKSLSSCHGWLAYPHACLLCVAALQQRRGGRKRLAPACPLPLHWRPARADACGGRTAGILASVAALKRAAAPHGWRAVTRTLTLPRRNTSSYRLVSFVRPACWT